MHLRDGILSPEVCLATAAVSAVAVGYSLRRLRTGLDARLVPLTGVVSAVIFAGQMINFPLFGLPVSGHLMGGVLAAVLLGPWAGCLAVTVVLLVQAVLFADGGLLSLGANVLNLAVVGAWGGGAIYAGLRSVLGPKARGSLFAAVLASYLSVLLAAGVFCGEFALSVGTVPFDLAQVTWWMLGYHALIGLGEAAITGSVLAFLWSRRPELLTNTHPFSAGERWALGTFAGACVVAIGLAPWASEHPDGLEAVADRTGFAERGRDSVLLLADYAVPVPAGWEWASLSLAGLLGTVLVLGLGWGLTTWCLPRTEPVLERS